MYERIKLRILTGRGLTPVVGGVGAEEVFDAASEPRNVPGQLARIDNARYALLEPPAQTEHPIERLVREDLSQRRPHRRQ